MSTLWTALLITLAVVGGIAFMVVVMMQISVDMTARALVNDGKADLEVTETLDCIEFDGEGGYDPASLPEVQAIEEPAFQRLLANYQKFAAWVFGAIFLAAFVFWIRS